MIDLKRSLLIVTTYPGHAIDHRTEVYFMSKGMPFENIIAVATKCSIVESRNRTIKLVVIPRAKEFDWFIFMDRDQYPIGQTDTFLDDVKFDAVGCTYKTNVLEKGNAWLSPEDFHMGLCRIRSEAIVKIKPPWFMFTYNDEGTKIISCECNLLKQKLLEQGCTITRRGWLEHDNSITIGSWHGSA